MPMDLASIGKTIRMLRKNKGLTQEQLAELTGHHPVYISQVERGVKTPSMEAIGNFAKTLGLTPGEFVYLSLSPDTEIENLKKGIISLVNQQNLSDLKVLYALVKAYVKSTPDDQSKVD
jgi:transcriptional regulator with XRE-family HTH domain